MHQLNSKTNDLVLLLKTIWRYWNCFLSPVATDGMDGNGLKFEKNGHFFQFLMLRMPKPLRNLLWSALWQNSLDIFVLALQQYFCLWLKPRDAAPLSSSQRIPSQALWKPSEMIMSQFSRPSCFPWYTPLIMTWVSGQKTSRKNKISHTLSISSRSFTSYIALERVKYCLFSEYLNLSMLFEPFRHRARKKFGLRAEKGVRKCFVTLTPLQSQLSSLLFFFKAYMALFFLFVIKNIYISSIVGSNVCSCFEL